ncbi:Rhodopsin, GQ-coupled [Holothuria leucospilota]|uniref:Rhodopsin, GQ-coupled n=1 Tax=Holothuria leucospilota TaxID=206669 RepID=A0A9Q1BUF0_HOLLE|nr:Rhodopsin, GQ-coupled [Holothuria leucospilota]
MALQTDDIALSIFIVVIAVVGVPSNILVIKVYFRRAKTSSTFVFISFMAISDLVRCGVMPLEIGAILSTVTDTKQKLCESKFFTSVTLAMLSLLTTAVVGFDRYMAVCWPHTKRLNVYKSLILSTTCLSVFIILSAILTFGAGMSSEENEFLSCKVNFGTGPALRFSYFVAFVLCSFSLIMTTTCYTLVWRRLRKQRLVTNLTQKSLVQSVCNETELVSNVIANKQTYARCASTSAIRHHKTYPSTTETKPDGEESSFDENQMNREKRNDCGSIACSASTAGRFTVNRNVVLEAENDIKFPPTNLHSIEEASTEERHELKVKYSGILLDKTGPNASHVGSSTTLHRPSKMAITVQRKINYDDAFSQCRDDRDYDTCGISRYYTILNIGEYQANKQNTFCSLSRGAKTDFH